MKTFRLPHTVTLPDRTQEQREDHYRDADTARAAELALRRDLDRLRAQGKILTYATRSPEEVRS